MTDTSETPRTRDPARKHKILLAAADLVARNGFNSVSMSEIGAASGITGSAIYRHFDSKSAVLVELFDSAIDQLLDDAKRKDQPVIIGGGDGSVRAAAQKLAGTQIPLGVIPLGTMNLFAREIEMPLDHEHTGRTLAGFRHRGGQAVDIVRAAAPRLGSVPVRAALMVVGTLAVLVGILAADRKSVV